MFAFVIFLTAESVNYNRAGTSSSKVTETYSHTLENVPINFKYDSNTYFISGYSYETSVYLTSINRVNLDSEINADTRSFQVVADLSGLTEGTHEVALQVTDLLTGVTAEVTPANVSVTIGKKQTKDFQAQLDESKLTFADGIILTDYTFDQESVSVTSDETTIGQIDHVEAYLTKDETISGNTDVSVTFRAVSASGTILPASITPSSANVSIQTKKLTKTVPVRVELTGNLDNSVSKVTFEAQYTDVVISGSQENLDKIGEVVVSVDVSSLTNSMTKPVSLSADSVTVQPATMSLKLTVTKKTDNTTSTKTGQ
ncbi:CdaR family protein [Streptococcus caprae]|uniref:YbbR-like domain-containing protein n=1 Tax=Streptococcus caprae TaxID=1640501 RepID=A0ABV8CVG6_9STRE